MLPLSNPTVADLNAVLGPALPVPTAKLPADPAPTINEPYWLPAGVARESLPPDVRAAIANVINPAYCELVRHTRPGLAQSTGVTIVHLLWLEALDQLRLGRTSPDDDPQELAQGEPRRTMIERHLRLVHSKLKASELWLRLEELKLTTPRSNLDPEMIERRMRVSRGVEWPKAVEHDESTDR